MCTPSVATITFSNNILTYSSPGDLGTTIDPAGLNDVTQSYGIGIATFQALGPQVVAFNGAPAPGTGMQALVVNYTAGETVTFTFPAAMYNYGSYTSYGRGAFSGSVLQDAMSTVPNTVEGTTDWFDATITTSSGDGVAALGFCAAFRNDQAVPAGQMVFTLSDSTTDTINLPALGGAGNPQYVFFGYQAPAGTTISRVQASRASTVGGAWISVDDLSFVMGDVTAPAAVTDLATGSPTAGSIALSWTAPGDNGSMGTATSYDVRYSTSPINEANWASATQATGEPVPAAAGTGQGMTVTGLSPSTTYYFAIKTSDEVPNTSALSNVPSGTTAALVGTGLRGQYYDNMDFTALTITRLDATVDFNWGSGSPDPAIGPNTFSVRWMGQVRAEYSETYTFYTVSDDGVRLWVDGQQVISNWTDHGPTEDSGQITLSAGQFYDIQMDFYENSGGAVARLLWSSPSTTKQVIPQANLYPPAGSDVTPPAAITDLAVSSPTDSSVVLSWTAPGDDGSTGTATSYDVRYSTSAINDGNWASAVQVSGEPTPAAAGTNQNMTVTGLGSGTTYHFAIRTSDEVPNVSALSNVPTGTTTGTAGTGLLGDYYNNMDFTDFALTRTDATVDFDWGTGSPDPAIGADTFSVRWTGQVKAQYSETYTFYTVSDDGVRLWVNGQQVISNWTNHAPTENSGQIALSAGQMYDIQMDYYENGGGAVARLLWSSPSTAKQVIPQAQLYSTPPDTTAPAAVTDLAAGSPTASSVTLTWTAPGDDGTTGTAASYDVRYSTSPIDEGNWTSATQATGGPAPSVAGSPESMVVSGLSSDTTYYFALKTSDEVPNVSALSNVATAATPDVTPPAAVTDLATSSPTGSTITLTWTAPGDDGSTGTAASYDVRVSPSPIDEGNFASAWEVIGEPAPATAGTVQSVIVSGLDSDTTYYFAIKTSDEVPNTSAISNVPSAATLDVTAPAAVTNLAAGSPTGSSVQLTWTAPGDDGSTGTASSYDVRYSTSPINEANWASATQATGEPAPAVAGTNQNMTVSGLTSDTTYYFAIKTSDEVPNVSALSNVPSATTLDVTAPAAVTNLAAGNATSTSLTLTWTAPGDDGNTGTATSYDVRYSTSTIDEGNWASATQATGEPAPAAAGSAESMTVSGLSASTTYYFAIKTSDEVPNTSALSNVASGTTSTPAQPPVTVLHIGGNTSGWRGGYNISSTYCWLANWPNSNADATIGQFDRAALQNAIDTMYSACGGWDAKIVVSQVSWNQTEPPAGMTLVAGSADLDPGTVVWQSSTAFSAGSGNWAHNGSGYGNFAAAVNAGTASGETVVLSGLPYTTEWDTSLPAACWNVVIDVPESLVCEYMHNAGALGLFVSSAETTALNIHANNQWSHQANIRVVVAQPPQAAPWIGLDTHLIDLTVAQTSPTANQVVTVTNAGSGTLSWTAAESPDVGWLSLSSASGGHNDTFTANIDVTGLNTGTYTTKILVSDAGAANSPQEVLVRVKVVPSVAPIIVLSPAGIDVSLAPSDPVYTQPVTVNNDGLNPLSWTAAEQGSVSWLSVTNGSGSDGDAFNVNIDPAGLTPGTYTASVAVTDPSASNSPQTLPISLLVREQDASIDIANGYDDAWETGANGWVEHCQAVRSGWSGTSGLVVHVGDSITYANPYGSWARYGSGKTAEDANVCAWMHSDVWGDGTNNSANGWYLAAYDVSGRGGSFTAKSGIRADQYIAGNYSLPSCDQMFTAGYTNPDGKQYRDAEMVVLMLGTNDASANRSAAAVAADLSTIIDKIEAAGVIVAISTIPPKRNDMTDVNNYNAEIRALAQQKKIPLIDYCQEILRRRPDNTWDGTLISGDGVHPSANYGGYTASSDPYASNGAALSCSGYLLRDWLSVQKIKEIREKVINEPTIWNVSTTGELMTAVANYASGDSIVIAPGTYYPTNRLYLDNGAVTVRGSTGNRDDVVISGPGMTVNSEPKEMFDVSSDDVTIKDLTIRDVYYHGIHMRGENDADRTKIQNVRTLNCGERHLKGSWNSGTPQYIMDDVLIENCLLEQTQPNSNHPDNDYIGGIDTMGVSNIIIRDNIIRGIQGPTGGGRAGIFIWHHNTNPTIERNLIYNCDRGISMGNPGWAGPGPASTYGIIRNNMIVRGANIGLELCFTDDMKVYHNTIYSADSSYFRTIHIYDSSSIDLINGLQIYYNIIRGQIYENASGSWSYLGNLTGSTPQNTWFVDPASGDLHLTAQATSAFNAASPLAEVTDDYDQQARSSTPDIGADETGY